ncbi:serine/threonine-protein phosphatase [Clostridium estertheticum]|uniref:PP2C family protein-serine/threonine phosphatase n=1 Tax=Clostridium estertheticum TaxID=238834 RepID=UPI001C0B2DC3|nr:PP2C family serine/threonine-protein phosphatase [Clostridium estertheticum]MBU3215895.1 serine/threonine-protein phosphatase [Clostridium estertheticum]WAG54117.1 serine/threonine-protein phosphatase [Clostridium estertheticum]
MGNFKINSFGISDKGIVKAVNQDSFVYKVVEVQDAHAGLFAVADGVGGLKDGEISSAIAISNFNKWWDCDFRNFYNDTGKLIPSLIESFTKCNEEIMSYSRLKNVRTATTLSVLFIHKNIYYIVHIGDSRIYKVTRKIERLTIDHSCLVDKTINGKIYKQSALTECLGNRAEINYYCATGKISKNDIFMVCSDGIYKTIGENEILEMVSKQKMDLEKACKSIINEVKDRGETDNITLILARISK